MTDEHPLPPTSLTTVLAAWSQVESLNDQRRQAVLALAAYESEHGSYLLAKSLEGYAEVIEHAVTVEADALARAWLDRVEPL